MPKRTLMDQVQSLSIFEEDNDFFSDGMEEKRGKRRGGASYPCVLLPTDRLVEYQDDNFEKITGRPQPFLPYSKEDMGRMVESVREHGVLEPITVRPAEDKKYQILAGRNRYRASVACGRTEIPSIIRSDIDDRQAALIMLDTNLRQRRNLSYSERAYAYRMKLELTGSQGKRNDLSDAGYQDSLAAAGKENKESRRMVAYLIRLTYLIQPLLDAVDQGSLSFRVGVKLSYIPEEFQSFLFFQIMPRYGKIKMKQADAVKKLVEEGSASKKTIQRVFYEAELDKHNSRKMTIQLPDALSYEEAQKLVQGFLKQYQK